MKNRAGWLALIVLAIASLLMIFVVMPRINHDGKPVAAAINAAGDAVKDAVTEGNKPQETAKVEPQATVPSSANQAAPAPTSPAAPAPASENAAADTPTFDVLRVEPDGSAVIAGHAAPNSVLEITNGTSVIAKVEVGPSGDFAAVLDKPLPPGDHQIVLKATSKDGKVVTSEEIATVSVPADKNGKLLAMVTKPGKASRLIAVPEEANKVASAQAGSLPAAAAAGAAAPATTPAPQGSGKVASAPAAGTTAPIAAAPAMSSELQITAVEIEGSKIFIAGISRSGRQVRGSADGSVVGQAQAGGDGHFVIDGNANLTVGDHRIAVEALGSNGQVLVRVEVPFNRPAGDQVAAIASPSPVSPVTAVDGGAFDNLRGQVAKAFSLLKGLYDAGKVPSLESMAAARSATGIALQSLAEYRLPAGASINATEAVGVTAGHANAARQVLDALPRDVAAVGEALDNLTKLITETVGPALAQQFGGAPQTMASTGGARTIEQAPLTQSDRNSVIIRRGDTLWQIARRAYGQGVRYTTIYLANEEQIANPDVIQPGQIFGVPEEFRPDSEELHRERLQHRKG
ncbi:LysM peptidoglycan-binding domain-containing protein [Aliirhizobium smilacinae]|uniref:LysM peptidoglycan-binding domain-containing protein n=1 Tax=Aliirhizobium smilacinae TaxID=1395944 RepID=A0A5C4XQE6_9HYPH|nr:LysM peptidoglycan-binding domain-containing protein [Rhizobium smilacinae]TNM65547.1 LysM peptidoglycan-binding domain-containing protein [Rhizobium smilacinae]